MAHSEHAHMFMGGCNSLGPTCGCCGYREGTSEKLCCMGPLAEGLKGTHSGLGRVNQHPANSAQCRRCHCYHSLVGTPRHGPGTSEWLDPYAQRPFVPKTQGFPSLSFLLPPLDPSPALLLCKNLTHPLFLESTFPDCDPTPASGTNLPKSLLPLPSISI